jgi:hypothetical protein
MADEWARISTGVTGPPRNAAEITPNDSADLDYVTRCIYVGTSGDVTVDLVGIGTNITYANLPSGFYLIGFFSRVYSTGTTASDLVGMW